jgi:hypothetical protein
MSIAVSADIKPSRLLLALMAMATAVIALIGVVFAFALVGQLSFVFRISLAVVCVVVAGFAFWLVLKNRKAVWLHISATGQIRLVEHHAGWSGAVAARLYSVAKSLVAAVASGKRPGTNYSNIARFCLARNFSCASSGLSLGCES